MTNQLLKWLVFCDEEGRQSLPAEEGDLLAFIGYLSLEGRVGPQSARQYVTSVSRYHEDSDFQSPTNSRMVARLLTSYGAQEDRNASNKESRAGVDAGLARRVLRLGLDTEDVGLIGSCAMVLFSFMFSCRSVTVSHIEVDDVEVTGSGSVRVRLTNRKAKPVSWTLLLSFLKSYAWIEVTGPQCLLSRWTAMRPLSAGFFNLGAEEKLGAASLGDGLRRVLAGLGEQAPEGYYYGSHSMRIGSFNELVQLQFSREWLLHRLDWSSEAMFRVYSDSRISKTKDSV